MKAASSSAVTRSFADTSISPCPTALGVFGMMRMIFFSPPSISAKRSRLTPASMETKTASDAAMSSASFAATPANIWGFTPQNTNRLSRRIAAAVSAAQPMDAAAFAECSAVEQATATAAPPTVFTAARARAPPIFPAPIKPASY